MHLLYLDEAGKSGPLDFSQPYYVLGGMVVHESKWKDIEADLDARIDAIVPPPRDQNWELHMAHIFHGKKHFKAMPHKTRYDLVDAVFDVLDVHRPTLIMVAINKKKHLAKYGDRAQRVEEVAYRLMLERFNTFIGRHPTDRLGLVVADEQKEVELPTRRAHSLYRKSGTYWATIDKVIETPFYTPSHWSRMLQIVDVATYWVGKTATAGATSGAAGKKPSPYWYRVEKHLDCYPHHHGKGLKIFPAK